MFIFGLKDDIQKEVVKFKPNDIQEAFDMAALVEGKQVGSGSSWILNHQETLGGINPRS